MSGRGVGRTLIEAAEAQALARGCRAIRLEVHPENHAAIGRYRKSGYREFARYRRYYEDGGDALRFEKRLVPNTAALKEAPPYFHQTTEFTCGPACIMMALAWADTCTRPSRSNLRAGAGLRVPALARSHHHLHQLRTGRLRALRDGGRAQAPRARAGDLRQPCRSLFPRYGKSADKRRVMQLTQAEFRREAKALAIPCHMTPVNKSVLMRAFDAGSVAIVLVSGYHMVARGKPHWIFAFGRDGRHVLMHDPAAIRDDQGMAAAAETYAVPWTAFERVTRLGRERLSAAIVIRKGPS